jgi:lipopolysaccharide export system permease protein
LLNTFDRYLFSRFLFLFCGFFAASMGLFAVVDGFTNLEAFQRATAGQGLEALLGLMSRNYLYQCSWVFDLVGPTLTTMAVVAVLALLRRHGELNPILAAGVPLYRLSVPLIAGVLVVHVVLAVNKELILPRISGHLSRHHGQMADDGRVVEAQFDNLRAMFISGRSLVPATRTIRQAEFRLGASGLVEDLTVLKTPEARYFSRGNERPAGWLLSAPTPSLPDVRLTELGRKTLIPHTNGRDLFVVTDITWDQLYDTGTSYAFLSTPALLRRIQSPSTGAPLARAQRLHLHARLTRPLLNVVGLFLVIPLVLRRESRSMVTDIAVCMAVLTFVIGLGEFSQYLSRAGLLSEPLAIWTPLILGGGCGAYLSPLAQT